MSHYESLFTSNIEIIEVSSGDGLSVRMAHLCHPTGSFGIPVSLAISASFVIIRPLPFQYLHDRRDPALIGGAEPVDRRPARRNEVRAP